MTRSCVFFVLFCFPFARRLPGVQESNPGNQCDIFGGYILLYYLPHLTLFQYIDLARAKSKALNDNYSLLKLNIKSCNAKQRRQRER